MKKIIAVALPGLVVDVSNPVVAAEVFVSSNDVVVVVTTDLVTLVVNVDSAVLEVALVFAVEIISVVDDAVVVDDISPSDTSDPVYENSLNISDA